jgi:NAD(P)-dependent dehydrogenase (short-subunit alcohol dehydrogenase family)
MEGATTIDRSGMGGRVLVTGCSSGIGRACVEVFGEAGFEVVATARKLGSLDDLTAAQRLQLDVGDDRSVETAFSRIGDLDVLINNAGGSLWGPVEEVPVSEGERLFRTNVWGALRVFQAAVPGMRRRGSGRVVNVSSLAANGASAMLGFYAASKAALSRFGDAMCGEVAPSGISVSTIELAGVESDFPANRRVFECRDPGYAGKLEEMGRLMAERRSNAVSSRQAAEWILGIVEEESPAKRYVVGLDQRITRVE